MTKAGEKETITFERSLDMRFIGQGSETNVPISSDDFTKITKTEVRELFDEIYKNLYGRTYPESPVEIINYKVRASLPEHPLELPKIEKKVSSLNDTIKGTRKAYSAIAGDFIPYTVYDRYLLFPDAQFHGPAIIEERESTVVVGEDASISVDDFGFLWIDLRK